MVGSERDRASDPQWARL